MIAEKIPEIAKMDEAEKLILVSELIGDIRSSDEEQTLTEEFFETLESEMADFRRGDSNGVSWEEVKRRARAAASK